MIEIYAIHTRCASGTRGTRRIERQAPTVSIKRSSGQASNKQASKQAETKCRGVEDIYIEEEESAECRVCTANSR